MANTKEIKNRIKSVKDTQKITNAMYLIASTKVRRAKNKLDETRPYFEALKNEINRAFAGDEEIESKYFAKEKTDEGTWGYLVITADKGLAGAYNQNVLKEAVSSMQNHTDNRVFIVGEYGRRYFVSKHISIDEGFNYMALEPTLERAREMAYYILDLFQNKQISKLFIVYTDYKNGISGGNATTMEVLPFEEKEFRDEGIMTGNFEFIPSAKHAIEAMIPSYLMGIVYSCLVDSFCSEQNARMAAMDSANENAEDILNDLSTEYNHLRQGAITIEITEVSSGARAKKKIANKRKGSN